MNSRPPFPSSPPSQPSPYRYLGRGGSERPVRLQIIIALVAGLILVAVPLYLWRRPKPEPIPSADAAMVDAGAYAADAGALADAGSELPAGVTLSPFTTIKCENPGPGTTPPERCDHVTFFEDALSRAIRDNVPCAPTSKATTQVSFVFEMDFRRKRTNLYAGKSTSREIRGKTKELIRCVRRAMPTPDWGTIPHQYVKYRINVMATYPPTESF
ncbi:hypothetical protein SOCE26_071150 [Sorangium cellulosum]|uniref:Uncharacterized protein n=1 Tax=Sorangium cellulosum TaxID=56 RepID=A0A2L0F250_SORCE|nr:hypothetical protein [Sorangium cellulosum]AUX45620.1 hypothetical protein SOCE26_071150 [Sorangium cellulosum]